jgi:hypothetical protein
MIAVTIEKRRRNRTMKSIIALMVFFSLSALSETSWAQHDVQINLPDAVWANVYAVYHGAKRTPSQIVHRSEALAESFGVPVDDLMRVDIRGDESVHMGVLYGETPRWSYAYSPPSGFESFADLNRFLKSDDTDKTPLIAETTARDIALDFIGRNFDDTSLSEIRDVKFSRVWDAVQLTPDEGAPIVRQTSNEAVIKVSRAIDGIPVFGQGSYKVHIANDGTVVAAFMRFRDIEEVPVDAVALPTKEELRKIADDNLLKYCGGEIRCRMRIDVGYYETGSSKYQELLEPVVLVRISQHLEAHEGSHDTAQKHFTIPLRPAHIAENPVPEYEAEQGLSGERQ